jgi:carbonic anhydrase/acetyltransferase-like protein (isoleucine patch superfamily)
LVASGDLGGYIEKETNLSHYGNAWVSGNARVYENAMVSGNAEVYENAWVSGNAMVYGNAWVSGNARVYENAMVSGNARVYENAGVSGNARVYGNAEVSGNARVENSTQWLLVGPAKSSKRFTTAFKDSEIGVRVVCGCFTGSVKEFSDQIEKEHKDNKEYLEQYRLFCQLIAFNFGVEA